MLGHITLCLARGYLLAKKGKCIDSILVVDRTLVIDLEGHLLKVKRAPQLKTKARSHQFYFGTSLTHYFLILACGSLCLLYWVKVRGAVNENQYIYIGNV